MLPTPTGIFGFVVPIPTLKSELPTIQLHELLPITSCVLPPSIGTQTLYPSQTLLLPVDFLKANIPIAVLEPPDTTQHKVYLPNPIL